MKKAIAAILISLLASMGYVVVDKDYLANKEKEAKSYSQSAYSYSSMYDKESVALSNKQKEIYSKNYEISSLLDVSREYASHKCTTLKSNETEATSKSDNTTKPSDTTNPVGGTISWDDLYVGMKIPVKVDIQHYPYYSYNQNLATDYEYEFSNAYAEITKIPSSTKVEYEVYVTVKVTRKSSTYYNEGLTVVLGYDDFCGNKTVEDNYIRYTEVACCSGDYGEDGDWVNNSITNTAHTTGACIYKTDFPDDFSGFVIDAICSCPGNGGLATL